MKQPANQQTSSERGRNIALGAALGLVIGGGLDYFFGDTGWGMVIGILVGALVGYWVKFPLPRMEYPAYIVRRMFVSGVFFMATLLAVIWMINNKIGLEYKLLISLAPAIPAILFALSIGSAISQLDELQRRIQLEAIGIGFGASVIVALIYALLVAAGLPQVSWMFAPLIMVLMWGAGKMWTMWKYR
jgi:hypothetical protein